MIELYVSSINYNRKEDIPVSNMIFKYSQVNNGTLEQETIDILTAAGNGYTLLPGLFWYELNPNTLFENKWHEVNPGGGLCYQLPMTYKIKKYWRGGQLFFLDIDKAPIDPMQFISNLRYKPSGGYTTFSNDPSINKNCFRLMYVFDRVLDIHEWTSVAEYLYEQAANDNPGARDYIDKASKRGVQAMNGTSGVNNIITGFEGQRIYTYHELVNDGMVIKTCEIDVKPDILLDIIRDRSEIEGGYGVRSNGSIITGKDFVKALFPTQTITNSDGTHETFNIICTGNMLHDTFGVDGLPHKLSRIYTNQQNDKGPWNPVELNGEIHYYKLIEPGTFRRIILPWNGYQDPGNPSVTAPVCNPGWGRHKEIYRWGLQLARLGLYHDEIIYNLIWLTDEYINRGKGNDVIDSHTIVDIVSDIFSMSYEDLLEETSWWDDYCEKNYGNIKFTIRDFYTVKFNGHDIHYYTEEDKQKKLYFREIVKKLVDEQLMQRLDTVENSFNTEDHTIVSEVASSIGVSKRTVYNDMRRLGIDAKSEDRRKISYEHTKNKRNRPNKLTDDKFLELYDPNLSNEENMNKINDWGDKQIIKIRISIATYRRYKYRLIKEG